MKQIKLTQGKYTLVDDEEFDWLSKWSWCLHTNGYAQRGIFSKKRNINKMILMHREIMKPRDEEWIDHINQNKLDNRKSNLRICNASTNGANQKISIKNTSGYKGVNWDKSRNKWLARIAINKKQINLGRYNSLIDAALSYNQAAIKYFGEFSRLNML